MRYSHIRLRTEGMAMAALAEIDKRHLFHPFTALASHDQAGPPAVIVRGEGVWLEDDHGRRYIDAMARLWCVNAGYGRRASAREIDAVVSACREAVDEVLQELIREQAFHPE